MRIENCEASAKNEADKTFNKKTCVGWLRIVWLSGNTFLYYHDIGRKEHPLTRESAAVILAAALA